MEIAGSTPTPPGGQRGDDAAHRHVQFVQRALGTGRADRRPVLLQRARPLERPEVLQDGVAARATSPASPAFIVNTVPMSWVVTSADRWTTPSTSYATGLVGTARFSSRSTGSSEEGRAVSGATSSSSFRPARRRRSRLATPSRRHRRDDIDRHESTEHPTRVGKDVLPRADQHEPVNGPGNPEPQYGLFRSDRARNSPSYAKINTELPDTYQTTGSRSGHAVLLRRVGTTGNSEASSSSSTTVGDGPLTAADAISDLVPAVTTGSAAD